MMEFIRIASNIRVASFGGYAGLYRSEIKIAYENLDYSFKYKTVKWAIEYLDIKLREYLNSKD